MKNLLLSVTALLFAFSVSAQKIEIQPYAGYFLGGTIHFYEGELKINDNVNYGITIGANPGYGTFVGLDYTLLATSVQFYPYYSSYVAAREADFNQHVIQVVFNKEVEASEKVTPYIGMALGMVIADLKYENVQDEFRFNMSIQGGLKINLSEKIGIRLQARLLMPMYFAGVGVYAGYGTSGASTGMSVSTGIVAWQGDFTGGLVFKF